MCWPGSRTPDLSSQRVMLLTKSPPGGLLGGQAPPRIRHAPSTRANAWEDVSDLCAAFGLQLDPWQEEVLQAGLGERSDGRWAARQVGCSTPRQNGKTMLIVARVLAGLLIFDEQLIIVSAHRQDTARETFFRLVQIIDENPELRERVDFIARSEMREFIRLKSGQEVRFKARSAGSGRGFSSDCLLLDEAQILGAAAWSAILPTMSARPNPQVWLFGTPPTENDDGEVFERLRGLGLEGKESRVAYLEWSADRDDPLDDPETWAKANPAFGFRIDHEAVAAERAAMSDEQFAKERLGVWDEVARHKPLVSTQQWRDMADLGPADDVRPDALGVDMSHGRDISVAGCWIEDEKAHLEQVWAGSDPNIVIDWIVERAGRIMPVVIDAASPASSLVPELKARKCKVVVTNAADMAQACGLLENRIHTAALTHSSQPALTDAIMGARKRPIRDAGGWALDRRDPSSSIYPIVAATLALFGATTNKRSKSVGRVLVLK